MFVTYARKDGVGLSGTLYLPAGYRPDQRVPVLVWAYPQEFVDADAASQVVGSPHRFTFVRGSSHLLLLAHGYGAFMTANLLPHSDIVAAGVARSGAYNAEAVRLPRRDPYLLGGTGGLPDDVAVQLRAPDRRADLLIHGEADNSGTFPIQSERMYMALKGHGATVRYVTLPAESHGYAARESNLHVVAETVNWLDRYVTAASPTPATPE